jgi:hypothetical protein
MKQQEKKKIFICYASADKGLFEAFKKGIVKHGKNKIPLLELLDDTEITIGAKWYEKIGEMINLCNGAILLVSGDFLNSDFIRDEEVSKFIKKCDEENFILCPILLTPCEISGWKELEARQFFRATQSDYNVTFDKSGIMPYSCLFINYSVQYPNPFIDKYHIECLNALKKRLFEINPDLSNSSKDLLNYSKSPGFESFFGKTPKEAILNNELDFLVKQYNHIRRIVQTNCYNMTFYYDLKKIILSITDKIDKDFSKKFYEFEKYEKISPDKDKYVEDRKLLFFKWKTILRYEYALFFTDKITNSDTPNDDVNNVFTQIIRDYKLSGNFLTEQIVANLNEIIAELTDMKTKEEFGLNLYDLIFDFIDNMTRIEKYKWTEYPDQTATNGISQISEIKNSFDAISASYSNHKDTIKKFIDSKIY